MKFKGLEGSDWSAEGATATEMGKPTQYSSASVVSAYGGFFTIDPRITEKIGMPALKKEDEEKRIREMVDRIEKLPEQSDELDQEPTKNYNIRLRVGKDQWKYWLDV